MVAESGDNNILDWKAWIQESVSFGEALDTQEKKSWDKLLASLESRFASSKLPPGSLVINEPVLNEDFSFWLVRAFKRDHAQASHYDCVKDELIERELFWRKTGAAGNGSALLPLTPKGKYPALFLDRDGIINVDGGYIHKVEDVKFVAGIEDIIKFANAKKIKVVVLTNQSGVGRGLYKENDVLTLHQWMGSELLKKGARVDAWYYSPYHPEATENQYKRASYTRKPLPGMALTAAEDHSLAIERSAMIGDKVSDVLAQVDIETFLLKGNYPLGNYSKVYENHQNILDSLARFFGPK
jgi:D-glycero-D-manno-heptose 1,7-bisphosphate phosphatase